MVTNVGPTAGSKLYIGSTEVISSPDDWVEIGNIASFGDFGRVYNEIKAESVGSRNVIKFKGTRDDGTLQITVNRDAADSGQAAVIAAIDSDLDYNWKITLNDKVVTQTTSTTFIFAGKILSYQTKMGGPNNVVQADISIGITSGSITETAAS